jgi:hypothetical protein
MLKVGQIFFGVKKVGNFCFQCFFTSRKRWNGFLMLITSTKQKRSVTMQFFSKLPKILNKGRIIFPRWKLNREGTFLASKSSDQGPMLWFFKHFRRKIQRKNWRFLLETKLNYAKSNIITLVFEKNANFFAENCQKIAENCDHNIEPWRRLYEWNSLGRN